MFDWLEYDETVKKQFAEQEKRMGVFLNRYIEMNSRIRELPIYDKPTQDQLAKVAAIDIPRKGRDPLAVGEELVSDVFEQAMLIQHPRFFSFVASAVSPYSLAGSILSDIYNLHAGGYEQAPCAALIEEKLIHWMGNCAGYPEESVGGVFLSGGSMGNMSAMVAARDAKLEPQEYADGIIYFSDQTHSSNAKGLRIIGFGEDQCRKIPTDDDFRIRLDLLEQAIKDDLKNGKKPFAVIGNLGTTNTGAIDPLSDIGAIAQKYNLWFHVDGAFGGSILISKVYRNMAEGIELTDSFTWDTHKWLLQTYSCSSLIVKDRQNLLRSFSEHPEYLADVTSSEHADSWDLGPEMTRPYRGLKLWYTIQATGTDLLSELIEYSIYNAKLVESELNKLSNWEILSKPSCATINFHYVDDRLSPEQINELNHKISQRINQTGFAYIVTTTLKGVVSIRMCTINANTTEKDITETIALLDKIAKKEVAKYILDRE